MGKPLVPPAYLRQRGSMVEVGPGITDAVIEYQTFPWVGMWYISYGALRGRGIAVLVAADDPAGIRTALGELSGEFIGGEAVVRIEELNPRTVGQSPAVIARRRRTRRGAMGGNDGGILLGKRGDNPGRFIGRIVIHQDDFARRQGLGQHTRYGTPQERCSIINRNDDGSGQAFYRKDTSRSSSRRLLACTFAV